MLGNIEHQHKLFGVYNHARAGKMEIPARIHLIVGGLLFLLASGCNAPFGTGGGSYFAGVERLRKAHEKNIFSDPRLMTVARLELRAGKHTLGSDATNDLVLPVGPPVLGSIELHDKSALLELHQGLTGKFGRWWSWPSTRASLRVTPGTAPMTPFWVGSMGIRVQEWGGQIRLVVLDKQTDLVRLRKPLRWFPVQERYRIAAKFTAFPKPVSLVLPDSDGGQREHPSPGYVSFVIDDQNLTLQPIQSGKGLFFIFRDGTCGKQTYGAGRFLPADAPKNGIVILDFNRATNPLCAYNAFLTCPMPPRQNRLPVAIPAGEMEYPH